MSTYGFQTAEEFEAEMTALSKQPEVGSTQQVIGAQPSKKNKQTVDPHVLNAEREALEEIGATNWTGKLLEYRAANPVATEGLTYLDQILGDAFKPRFGCIAVIAEASHQFGAGVSFANKKPARQYASKKAIDWLIANQKMPADGSVRFPKIVKLPPRPVPASSGPKPLSFAGQVPDLCHRLGFNVPTYKFDEPVPQTALYDGWADFGTDPRVDGKVGVVKGVYGRKNAKEEVAKLVLSYLLDIERQRKEALVGTRDEEKKRKRRDEITSPEIPEKTVKVTA